MKKRIIHLGIIIIVFAFTIILLNTKSYAGSQKLKNLKYDVQLNMDGTVDVTEEWTIRVSDTNTLFKTFDLDRTKYGGIIDVEVTDITDETPKKFYNTEIYSYYVEKGGFYALEMNNKKFEIAWGVSINSAETRKYEIKYKLKEVIKKYEDCSEFYWQFVGKENGIPASKVEGTIKLPKEVTSKENLKVWAHGPLNGNIEIVDNKTVFFEVEDLEEETMVEARVVVTEDIFSGISIMSYQQTLSSILEEEGKWAEEANNQRQRLQTIMIGVIVVGAIVAIFFIIKIIKYIRILSKMERTKPETEYDYFREFPDETASAGEAAYLYYFDKKYSFNNNIAKIVSATILNLALKKAIQFEKTEKNDVLIIINSLEKLKEELTEDELKIYEMLKKAYTYTEKKKSKNDSIYGITMKDIEKYAKKNDTAFLGKIESIEKIVEKSEIEKGNYDNKKTKEIEKWQAISMFYFVFGTFGIFFFIFVIPIVLGLLSMICGILCNKIASKLRMLTQKGANEQGKWKALKRYMEEYSLLKEREVPELVLWEKYLVYATSFGIADKVLKQLKVTYPQLADESYMLSGGYTYLYMINSINIENAIAGGIQRAYTSGINARATRNFSSRKRWRRRLLSRRRTAGGGRSDGMGGR